MTSHLRNARHDRRACRGVFGRVDHPGDARRRGRAGAGRGQGRRHSEGAADAIGRAASARDFDAAALAREARASGTIAVPLVAVLTERVRAFDADAARFVHWGATSQDIVDTALVLLINRRPRPCCRADHARLSSALRTISDRHAGDVMLGRTLLQPAPPTTFGLKAAGWLAGASRELVATQAARDTRRVCCSSAARRARSPRSAIAALVVADALARELGLPAPDAPWHAYRDRLAALVAACGIYTGVLGKMARDVSLLMQAEVGEAAEPGGGSSTMPHKQNPVGCAIALAAATRMPGFVSAALSGLVQEHERGVGSWHAEMPTIAGAIQTTGAALAAMAEVASHLTVDAGAHARQHRSDEWCDLRGAGDDDGRCGAGPGRGARAHAGRDSAHTRQRRAARPRASRDAGNRARVDRGRFRMIDEADSYLGMAETFRQRLLASVDAE